MDVRPPRPRVLLVDESPHQRLQSVASLSSRFDVFPLPPGEDPLRAARARRPELVLFALTRANLDETLRYCRTLRTDVRPIDRVAVYQRGRALRSAEVVCDTWRADGYLAGEFDGAGLLDFVEAVSRGERPVRLPEASASPLGRLVDRLRRS